MHFGSPLDILKHVEQNMAVDTKSQERLSMVTC